MPTNSPPRAGTRSTILLRVLLILLIAGWGVGAGARVARAGSVTSDQAVSIVTRGELGGSLDAVRLWVHPQELVAGQAISTWRKDVFTAPGAGWFVFVDRYPGANWEHPCWYVFVDGSTGSVKRFDAMTPPTLRPGMTEITRGRDNPAPGESEASLARFSERLRDLPKPPPSRGQAYALIISGGADASNNHIRYWNDCAFIYRTLVQYYGYADDHIRVCMSDGTNPAVDRSDGTNSPADLDGDGDPDIEYPATQQYLGQVFGELAATLTPSDQLFIFTTDHGGQESGWDCYLNLWNWEQLRDDQMATLVGTLPCESIVCTFEQCFSGGMIDDLSGNGRVIATGASYDEYSWAMGPDYIYDTFVYHWTSAVAGQNPAGAPVDADTNNDGIVSMHEAFVYAAANDHEDETPQYNSNPAALGDMLNLLGNMEGVYLVVDGITVDDDALGASSGDGDGVVDFGETVEVTIALHNLGQSGASNVTGSLGSTSPYVSVVPGEIRYGTIPADGTVANIQPFVFTVAGDVPQGEPLGLALAVSEDPASLPLDLAATAPGYVVEVVRVDDTIGDSDGVAEPGESVGLTLRFRNDGGCCSPDISAALQGGGYFISDGAAHAVGPLPVGTAREIGLFAVQISADCPPIHTGELEVDLAAEGDYHATAGLRVSVGPWFDDAETDFAWTLGAPGDNATSGLWERTDPVGTVYNGQPAQAEDDHTTGAGHLCFVTGNGAVGGAAGEADVDGGKTTLLSPLFDMQGATAATISYWRWYTNNLGNSPGLDYWNVEVTADGSTWLPLEHTTESANSWSPRTFDLTTVVPLGPTIRFRFVASDASPGSLVEAAVDDITVSIVRQSPAGVTGGGAAGLVTGLGPCRPNPVGAETVLDYRLASRADVHLDLYDVAGRRVRTLLSGPVEAGAHELRFTPVNRVGRRLAAGVYFLRLETPAVTQVRQVTITG